MANILSTEDSGFEGGTTGTYTVDGMVITNSTAVADAGTHSLRLNPSGPTPAVITAQYACLPSHVYTVSAKVYQFTAAASVQLRIFWWDSGGGFLAVSSSSAYSTTVGSFIASPAFSPTSPSNAAFLSFNFYVPSGSVTGNFIHLDTIIVDDGGGGADTTPPTFTWRVNGDQLVGTASEALDTAFVPAASAFTPKVNTVVRGVSSVALANSGAGGVGVVTLTLASPVSAGQTVTLSYSP